MQFEFDETTSSIINEMGAGWVGRTLQLAYIRYKARKAHPPKVNLRGINLDKLHEIVQRNQGVKK